MKALSKLNLQDHEEDLTKLRQDSQELADIDVDEFGFTFHLLVAVVMAMISQFLVGYNTAVMNAPEQVVFPDHTTVEWSLAVSSFAVGGPGGAILGGYLANITGRRGAMIINTWIYMIGGLLMACALNIYWLVLARFIVGFASGLASVLVPVYLGEISPPTLRGALGTCTQFAMVIGILASSLFAYPLATPDYWRYLFLVTPFFNAFQLFISPYVLESPRWLLNKNENCCMARIAIKKLRGYRHNDDVMQEVENFLAASGQHKTSRSSAHSSGAMLDLLGSSVYRPLVIASIGLQLAQQLCGINAVFYYSNMLFRGVLDNLLMGTCLVSFVNVVATYLALMVMDHSYRRSLLLWSAGGMFISTVAITIALLGIVPPMVALLGVMAFVTFFEVGLGPIPWLIVAEMFDAKYVATAMSVSCIVNWSCNFLVGFLFPHVKALLGAWIFVPFGVVLVATFLFTLFYVTETYGRSIEEILFIACAGNKSGSTPGESMATFYQSDYADGADMDGLGYMQIHIQGVENLEPDDFGGLPCQQGNNRNCGSDKCSSTGKIVGTTNSNYAKT